MTDRFGRFDRTLRPIDPAVRRMENRSMSAGDEAMNIVREADCEEVFRGAALELIPARAAVLGNDDRAGITHRDETIASEELESVEPLICPG